MGSILHRVFRRDEVALADNVLDILEYLGYDIRWFGFTGGGEIVEVGYHFKEEYARLSWDHDGEQLCDIHVWIPLKRASIAVYAR